MNKVEHCFSGVGTRRVSFVVREGTPTLNARVLLPDFHAKAHVARTPAPVVVSPVPSFSRLLGVSILLRQRPALVQRVVASMVTYKAEDSVMMRNRLTPSAAA